MPVWRYLRIAVGLLLAAAWIGGVAWGLGRGTEVSWALWLEHWTGDFRTALFSYRPKRQHEGITLVTITDETMQPYPYRSPVDRRLLANLVTAVDKAGARAIGLDFLFLKPTEKRKDDDFVAALRKAKTRIVVAGADRRVDLTPAQVMYQRRFFEETGATAGYANLLTGGDRIVRYVARSNDPQFLQSFAAALAKPGSRIAHDEPRRIAWMLSPYDGNDRFFSIPAHVLITPDGKPTPVAAALLSRFKDKIVIIGGDFPDVDRHQVPMLPWRGEADEVAGLLIHAQVAAQIIDGRSKKHFNQDILVGVFALLALAGLLFGLRHGIVAVSLYATTASVVVVALDMVFFQFMDRIIPFGACVAALIAGVVGGFILRRFRPLLMSSP